MATFQLKEYQHHTLEVLRTYFRTCLQFDSANTAFYHLTSRKYEPVAELPDLPYICLRLPTGAGKTFLACHIIPIAQSELLQADLAVVLWLVPSNTILEQTLKALRDRQHPYRQALDGALGAVTVLDVSEALYVTRPTLDTSTTIIVATIQAFRVEDTDGRKVYDPSGSLMDHFSGYDPAALEGLETYTNGTVKTSLANVLRLRKPIVLVDEAHNARTSLSFGTLARFAPSCIIELTATPDTGTNPSNVLHQVSAAELKAEDMIKLPILLETRTSWKELLTAAIARLNELDKAARAEAQISSEYLRPIMLLQAQPRSRHQENVTVEVVEACLRDDFDIPKVQIARATGEDRELDNVDILAPTCPIRFVITVQALREGWDCSFAYVLCSVAELHSPTAIEQLLGRIMRLPNACRKQNKDLNQAYAFAASANFVESAEKLKDGLVQNGFERIEADKLVQSIQLPQTPIDFGPLFIHPAEQPAISLRSAERPNLTMLPVETAQKLHVEPNTGAVIITAVLTPADRTALMDIFTTVESKAAVDRAYMQFLRFADGRSPSERGERFSIPRLAFKQGELFDPFEESHFLDHRWRLSQQDPTLSEQGFPSKRSEARQARIDITDKQKLSVEFLSDLHQQMRLLASDQGWTETQLVYWLDRSIPHPDITASESTAFLTSLVQKLTRERGLSLDHLVNDKYRLRAAVIQKINQHRQTARRAAYQQALFGDDSPVVVSPECCFTYDPHRYPCTPYRGAYKFLKHYYSDIGNMNDEEVECAVFLDFLLPDVEIWIRNPERSSLAFWLQTASDRFYPDFVCKLRDGRFLVVEYKGANIWSNDDSREKRIIGEVWEARSEGQCLFVMPKGKDFEAIRAKLK